MIRVIFGILVLAIGAALPWIVQDEINAQKQSKIAPHDQTGSVHRSNPVGSQMLASVQNWFSSLGGGAGHAIETRTVIAAGDSVPTSTRSQAVAAKVTPILAPELTKLGFKMGDPVFVRIFKEESELEVWMLGSGKTEYELFKTYKICNYSGKLGPKLKEGDGQSPEGFYFVPPRQMNPESNYHLSFDIGFPNDFDRYHGRTGSYLMVHGACVSIGCYAMTDERIEEIYTLAAAALSGGQDYFRVHAFPFRMSDQKMNEVAAEKSNWIDFWANLKEGYDYFEMMKHPPNTSVIAGKYVFSAG